MTDKDIIRTEAKRVRDALQPPIDADIKFADSFFSIYTGGIVSAYWPKGKEASPLLIIEELLKQNQQVCLPHLFDHKMDFILYAGEALEKGAFGLMQPKLEKEKAVVPDVMVMPLLAFDRTGTRLGYGQGHYDRYLAAAEKPIKKIGIAYDEQLCLFPLPLEPHDMKLDIVITPSQVYKF